MVCHGSRCYRSLSGRKPYAQPIKAILDFPNSGFIGVAFKTTQIKKTIQMLYCTPQRPSLRCQEQKIIHISGVKQFIIISKKTIYMIKQTPPDQGTQRASTAYPFFWRMKLSTVFHTVVEILRHQVEQNPLFVTSPISRPWHLVRSIAPNYDRGSDKPTSARADIVHC